MKNQREAIDLLKEAEDELRWPIATQEFGVDGGAVERIADNLKKVREWLEGYVGPLNI